MSKEAWTVWFLKLFLFLRFQFEVLWTEQDSLYFRSHCIPLFLKWLINISQFLFQCYFSYYHFSGFDWRTRRYSNQWRGQQKEKSMGEISIVFFILYQWEKVIEHQKDARKYWLHQWDSILFHGLGRPGTYLLCRNYGQMGQCLWYLRCKFLLIINFHQNTLILFSCL